jgi:Tesmin/TSO1-like CXC domain, cysteine-rich domain
MDEEDLDQPTPEATSYMQEEIALGMQIAQFNLSGKSSSDSESSDQEKIMSKNPKVIQRVGGAEDDYREFLTFNMGPSVAAQERSGSTVVDTNWLSHQQNMIPEGQLPRNSRDPQYEEDCSRDARKKNEMSSKKKRKKAKLALQAHSKNTHSLQEVRNTLIVEDTNKLEEDYIQAQMTSLLEPVSIEMMNEVKWGSNPIKSFTYNSVDEWKADPSPCKANYPVDLSLGTQDEQANKPGCSCAKTKCIKMYCSCFSYGKACTSLCSCVECKNTSAHRELSQDLKLTEAQIKNKEGDICCNCKWSQCENSYCSCTKNSKGCGASCKCYSCKNVFGSRSKKDF